MTGVSPVRTATASATRPRRIRERGEWYISLRSAQAETRRRGDALRYPPQLRPLRADLLLPHTPTGARRPGDSVALHPAAGNRAKPGCGMPFPPSSFDFSRMLVKLPPT